MSQPVCAWRPLALVSKEGRQERLLRDVSLKEGVFLVSLQLQEIRGPHELCLRLDHALLVSDMLTEGTGARYLSSSSRHEARHLRRGCCRVRRCPRRRASGTLENAHLAAGFTRRRWRGGGADEWRRRERKMMSRELLRLALNIQNLVNKSNTHTRISHRFGMQTCRILLHHFPAQSLSSRSASVANAARGGRASASAGRNAPPPLRRCENARGAALFLCSTWSAVRAMKCTVRNLNSCPCIVRAVAAAE